MRLRLGPGEYVILKERPSAHSLVWPLIWMAVFGLLLAMGAAAAQTFILSISTVAGGLAAFLSYIIILLVAVWLLYVIALRKVIYWLKTCYILTNERFIIRRGMSSRDEESIPLGLVFRLEVRQGIFAKMQRAGTLIFFGAGGQETSIKDVPEVFSFHQEILHAATELTQRLREQGPGRNERTEAAW